MGEVFFRRFGPARGFSRGVYRGFVLSGGGESAAGWRGVARIHTARLGSEDMVTSRDSHLEGTGRDQSV